MKVQQLLKACEHLLEPSADAGWDAREIVCTALKIEPARFLRAYSDEAPTETVKSALAWAERRKMGEPLQYVLGRAWFMGLPFFVNESVLIPRQDTETLCELALQYIKEHPVSRALDLCTGSGALATALAVLGNMQMDAADISRDALVVARQNARENKAEVTFYCGDLWDALPSGAQYDLIVCNPPYLTQDEMGEISVEVAKEPSLALYGGQDGLDFYRRLAAGARSFLAPGGCLMMEIGSKQGKSVPALFETGYETSVYQDINGLPRVVRAQAL